MVLSSQEVRLWLKREIIMKCLVCQKMPVLMKSKELIEKWLKNITLMSIRNLELKKNLKKFRKPMMFCQMTIKKLPMIVMVMLHLIKLVDSVVEPEVLVALVALKMLT